MIDFVTDSHNLPFSVALVVMFGIALLEAGTLLFGTAMSGLLETLVHDIHIGPHVDLHVEGPHVEGPHLEGHDQQLGIHGPPGHSAGALSRFLAWLRIGQVPMLMLLIIFLTAFGLIGFGIQAASQHHFGSLLPATMAAIPAMIVSLPVVRVTGGLLFKVMPKDETDAVSDASFIGRVAVITLGKATKGSPAQAKLKDEYSQTHYLMVEPDDVDQVFYAGDSVIVISKNGAVFSAIRNTHSSLMD